MALGGPIFLADMAVVVEAHGGLTQKPRIGLCRREGALVLLDLPLRGRCAFWDGSRAGHKHRGGRGPELGNPRHPVQTGSPTVFVFSLPFSYKESLLLRSMSQR